ncbi:MAG TPA: hypothetical protein VM511_03145, partial [Luteolibacter sp.]|nr:hypothetical protein [Luteolibacter sp.]
MPDLIQFDCPSCAATLRIPLEMAGLRGPCPLCEREIVAPNPYTGIGAHFPPHQPLPEIEALENIVVAPEPIRLPVPEPEAAPAPTPVEIPVQEASPPISDRPIESPPLTEPAPTPSQSPPNPSAAPAPAVQR